MVVVKWRKGVMVLQFLKYGVGVDCSLPWRLNIRGARWGSCRLGLVSWEDWMGWSRYNTLSSRRDSTRLARGRWGLLQMLLLTNSPELLTGVFNDAVH